MTGIFISYRRVDSRTYSGRLFDRLSRHFGRDLVFMDVEGGIARGDDFAKTIEGAVTSVGAMVVVIGRQWLTCTDVRGGRRLDNPDDWVREEITIALNRGILLLPVLVDGASMPTAEELPQALRALARRQASEISDSRWDYDVGEIVKALERVVPPGPLAAHSDRRSIWTSRSFRRLLKWVAGTAAALLGLLILLIVWDALFAAKPSDYDFTVDPPQVRIRRDGSTVQMVPLRVTNTGRRAAPLNISLSFYSWTPSEGVLVIRDDTCKTRQIAPGETCTASIVFDPKWLTGDELEVGRTVNGQLYILAYGNGGSIPLMIEPESDLPATQDNLKPSMPSTSP